MIRAAGARERAERAGRSPTVRVDVRAQLLCSDRHGSTTAQPGCSYCLLLRPLGAPTPVLLVQGAPAAKRRGARRPRGRVSAAAPPFVPCRVAAARRLAAVYEGVVQDLIDELGRLPGVGPKSAQRIAFHLLQADPADVRRLVLALTEVKDKVRFCITCGNVAQDEQCRICRDPRRDLTALCVVEESKDVVAIEKTREFRGRYHILGGAISPIDGIGPDDLRIRELMVRLADGVVTEIILATDPNLEGEATASYLARLLKPMELRVTRLASGLPVGGDLEYADEITLGRAFEGRRLLDA